MKAITAPADARTDRAEAGFWAHYARNIATSEATRLTGALAVAGGYALALQGTYLEYGLAVGTARPLRDDDMRALDDFYASRGLPARLELHPAVAERDAPLLAAWGYASDVPMTVFERDVPPRGALPAGVEAADDRKGLWIETVIGAFADATPEADRERLRRATAACAAAATRLFLARVDGRPAGGGALAISGDAALLFSAAVQPEYRRRGVHRALVDARLQAAAAAGASYAFLKVAAGAASAYTAAAGGFTARYDRIRVRRDIVTKP